MINVPKQQVFFRKTRPENCLTVDLCDKKSKAKKIRMSNEKQSYYC